MAILLKNCMSVVTFDDEGRELCGVDILVEGGLVARVGGAIPLPDGAEVFDCSRHVVIPGMVNTHHHLFQVLTRNLPGAQNAKLFDWLVYLYPVWARVDAEAVRCSTMSGTLELLKTGATTTTDHLYLYPAGFAGDIPGLQFEAADRTGIRFCPTRGCMTRGRSAGGLPPDDTVQSPSQVLEHMARVIDAFHDPAPLAMRKVILAPCSPFSVEESVMRETAALARERGVRLHTHLVETVDEENYCLEKYGRRPLALMADLGWTGPDVFYAHGVWFDDGELDVLRETGTCVAHCPTSNMRLGSGIARVREMLDRGIRVGLAVDGSASNDSSDMLGEVRQALLLQRARYGPAGLTAREALRMATRGGADILGLEKLGQIREGFGADLAVFDLGSHQYAGAQADPVAALVFCGYDHRTYLTIVNGRVVVREGRSTLVDEEELVARVNDSSRKLREL